MNDENELQELYLKAARDFQNSPQKAEEDQKIKAWLEQGLEDGILQVGTPTSPDAIF